MTNVRKQMRLTPSERIRLKTYAAAEGTDASGLVRTWVEDFVKNGSDIEQKVKLGVFLDENLLAAAEQKARDEYGVPLADIVRHEIARLVVTR